PRGMLSRVEGNVNGKGKATLPITPSVRARLAPCRTPGLDRFTVRGHVIGLGACVDTEALRNAPIRSGLVKVRAKRAINDLASPPLHRATHSGTPCPPASTDSRGRVRSSSSAQFRRARRLRN